MKPARPEDLGLRTRQIAALQNPAQLVVARFHPRYRANGKRWITRLAVLADARTLIEMGDPVWWCRAQAAKHTGALKRHRGLDTVAHHLAGCGEEELTLTFDLASGSEAYRRMTDAELACLMPLFDIRGTDEAAQVAAEVPPEEVPVEDGPDLLDPDTPGWQWAPKMPPAWAQD